LRASRPVARKRKYEPTNLSAFTVDLAGAFRSAIESAGLQFEVQCTAENTTVSVDRSMWKSWYSTCSRTRSSSRSRAASADASKRDGDAVRLAVSDTGTGIPADQLPHVFRAVFIAVRGRQRAHARGHRHWPGVVQEIVRLHGGTIDVDSADGSGTTFTVRIRLTRIIPAGASAAPRPLEPPAAGCRCVQSAEAMGWTDTSAGRVPSPATGAGAVRILSPTTTRNARLRRTAARPALARRGGRRWRRRRWTRSTGSVPMWWWPM
jgi:hypothetical protein